MKHLAPLLVVALLAGEVRAQVNVSPGFCQAQAAPPVSCVGTTGRCYTDTDDNTTYWCLSGAWTAVSGASNPFADGTALVKGSDDATKLLRMEIDGFTTGTTRVVTWPDSNTTIPIFSQVATFAGLTGARTITLPDQNFTVAGLAVTQTFSATQTFTSQVNLGDNVNLRVGASTADTLIQHDTANTPDTGKIATGTESNRVHIVENGDVDFDFQNCKNGTSPASHPGLCGHSATQNTTAWWDLEHDGTNAVFTTGTDQGLIGPKYSVELITAGTGAPNVLTEVESRGTFTNEGATALTQNTLPGAAKGLTYTFIVQDADGIRVVAGSGDTIRIAGSVSAAAGRIDSTTIGSTVTLVAINATEWVAVSVNGTWVVT